MPVFFRESYAVIPIVGLRERREFIVRSPIETTPINYDAAKGNPMTAQNLVTECMTMSLPIQSVSSNMG